MDFPVSSSKSASLAEAFARLGIREADLKETFMRSGGPGGQHVNKVSTCVLLVHEPSGIAVRVQTERSQALNRFLARRELADRLQARKTGEASARQQEIWKIRKQKRKRGRRAKERMLEAKHRHADKKALRRPVDF